MSSDLQIDDFFNIVRKMNESYRSSNILITMGEDFHYQVANMWYKNLDKLIKCVDLIFLDLFLKKNPFPDTETLVKPMDLT